ncbi:MAG TPA: LOG family protein [Candidatus Hydrogenedentes bacterium]|nr:LOG family protein [Candidatus Hydrogenedentota bacterium]HOS02042.1 LOG family protein [Candidatus Hydrogenedentota bacterium]
MTQERDDMPKWPEKAYKNYAWLNSPDARMVRILSEFLEPQSRFRRLGVRDTVVFFGSARILSPAEATARLETIERSQAEYPEESAALKSALAHARHSVALSRYYSDAAALAEKLTRWSLSLPGNGRHFLVCSGGGPGIMEAANLGASLGGGMSVSLNISLPMEQNPNAFQTPELAFEFHYFFMRKFWFVYLAKALVAFPGGFGTLDEVFETLTLLQTAKTRKSMPVILYGSEYWKEIVHFDALVKHGMIDKDDLNLFHFCDTVDDAFDCLKDVLSRLSPPSPKNSSPRA